MKMVVGIQASVWMSLGLEQTPVTFPFINSMAFGKGWGGTQQIFKKNLSFLKLKNPKMKLTVNCK